MNGYDKAALGGLLIFGGAYGLNRAEAGWFGDLGILGNGQQKIFSAQFGPTFGGHYYFQQGDVIQIFSGTLMLICSLKAQHRVVWTMLGLLLFVAAIYKVATGSFFFDSKSPGWN